MISRTRIIGVGAAFVMVAAAGTAAAEPIPSDASTDRGQVAKTVCDNTGLVAAKAYGGIDAVVEARGPYKAEDIAPWFEARHSASGGPTIPPASNGWRAVPLDDLY